MTMLLRTILCTGLLLAAVPNTLGGVEKGAVFDPTGWQHVGADAYGRAATFLGFPAALTVGVQQGRINDIAMIFIVAHPNAGISPLQEGLTTSNSPMSKAKEMAAAIEAQYLKEGFQKLSGVVNAGGNRAVTHFCASGGRERTLLATEKEPGMVAFVETGVPPVSNCP